MKIIQEQRESSRNILPLAILHILHILFSIFETGWAMIGRIASGMILRKVFAALCKVFLIEHTAGLVRSGK